MAAQSKYDLANQVLRGRLASELIRRRQRRDTWDDIMFWLRQRGVRVSRPTVMAWYKAAVEQQPERRAS